MLSIEPSLVYSFVTCFGASKGKDMSRQGRGNFYRIDDRRKPKIARQRPYREESTRWDIFFKYLVRIEVLAALISMPIIGVVGFFELKGLVEQQRVNAWQVLAIKDFKNIGKRRALETLVKNSYCLPLFGCLLDREIMIHAQLKGAFLQEAQLVDAYLYKANFEDAELFKANLKGAMLQEADMKKAKFRCADLRGANLIGADLTGANLTGAKLSGAEFTGTQLEQTDLSNVDLSSILLNAKAVSEANKNSIGAFQKACVKDYQASTKPIWPNKPIFKNIELEVCERYKKTKANPSPEQKNSC